MIRGSSKGLRRSRNLREGGAGASFTSPGFYRRLKRQVNRARDEKSPGAPARPGAFLDFLDLLGLVDAVAGLALAGRLQLFQGARLLLSKILGRRRERAVLRGPALLVALGRLRLRQGLVQVRQLLGVVVRPLARRHLRPE